MNEKLKRKMFGLILVLLGSTIIAYSIFSATSIGFISIYIGTMMLVAGLSILGLNVSPYGFG